MFFVSISMLTEWGEWRREPGQRGLRTASGFFVSGVFIFTCFRLFSALAGVVSRQSKAGFEEGMQFLGLLQPGCRQILGICGDSVSDDTFDTTSRNVMGLFLSTVVIVHL